MSIFPSESSNAYNESKTEFEKIGVNTISPYMVGSEWVFTHNNREYPLAPSPIVSGTISPIIVGADSFIRIGCKSKNIKNPEQGFNLLFSQEYFPTCDVRLKFKDYFFDGYVYLIESQNFTGSTPHSVFICSFVNILYKAPPTYLYLKAESLS
jgi:hypothetical protein